MAKKDDLTIFLRAEDKTKKAFGSVSKSMDKLKKLGGAVSKALGVITGAAVAVGAALVKTFNNNAPYIDALGKTADKLGVTTEKLQAYRDAAEFAGIGNASLDTSLQRFIRRLGTATTGVGVTNTELQKLGLNAKELAAQGPAQAFETILDKIKGVESQTERVRLAFQFFGKEGVDLVRLTTEAISKSEEEMERLGLSISRIDAARVEMANDAIKRLGDLSSNVGRRITANLSGAITVLTNRVIGAASKFISFGDSGVSTSERILVGIGRVIDVFRLFATGVDFARLGIAKLQLKVLEFARSATEAFSTKLLQGLSSFDNQIGVFAQGMLDAGAGTDVFGDKIVDLYGDIETLNNNIATRLGKESAVKTLLDDLKELNAEAERIGSSLGALNNPGIVTEVDGLSGNAANDGSNDQNEKIRVTREQLKLFSVDTDRAKANTEAFQSVLSSTSSALNSLGDSFAKTKKQARIFVAIQEVLAVVSAYSAATQALASITEPTKIQKFAAYAAVLARGLAGVAAIKKAGSSLGATGSASSSAASAASVNSTSTNPNTEIQSDSSANNNNTQNERPITIQLSGGGILGEEILTELVDQLNRRGLSRQLQTAA